jgi:hypothetical protein
MIAPRIVEMAVKKTGAVPSAAFLLTSTVLFNVRVPLVVDSNAGPDD